jgi:hypothetical protein
LAPELTEDEKKMISEESVINGCYKLLMGRCINNIEIDMRPMHLVDEARKKYLLRSNGNWITDKGGEKIMEHVKNKLKGLYTSDTEKDSNNVIQEKNMKLMELFSSKISILPFINEFIILKNNKLLLKEHAKLLL